MDRPRRRLATTVVLASAVIAGCTTSSPAPAPGSTSASPTVSQTGAGADGLGDPYYPADGNGGYDVTDYNVSITYDPATEQLEGDTTVTARATADLGQFNLDLTGFDVSAVDVNDTPAEFSRQGEHELVIKAQVAKDAQVRTRVRYKGKPVSAEDGQLGVNGWQKSRSGGAFVAGEPHSATFWFPANDHPRDKATFRLTARVPDGWSVVSNGREEPSTRDGGWTTFHWVEPTRLATYLTTIGIDKWTVERSTYGNGIPLVSAYAPGAEGKKQMEARLPEILDFLASKFGPYPQSAAGGIYLNEDIGFSLETQGRPVYAKWTQLDTVVHENAHQWFGDSVTVDTWSDICLNECFASYAQWLWNEAKDRQNLDDRYRSAIDRVKTRDAFWGNKLHGMGSGNEFNGVYDKGVLAIHALRRQIGEDAFNRVLKEWPAAHKDGNASWKQFEDFVQQIAGQDLRGFYDAWFHGDKIPADQHLFPGSLRR